MQDTVTKFLNSLGLLEEEYLEMLTHGWYDDGPAQGEPIWLVCRICNATCNSYGYAPPGGYYGNQVRLRSQPCNEALKHGSMVSEIRKHAEDALARKFSKLLQELHSKEITEVLKLLKEKIKEYHYANR